MCDKLFILVRRDLDWPQRAVQTTHALAELMYLYGEDPQIKTWAGVHKTLVLLGVEDERELLTWGRKLEEANIIHAAFKEPDKNYETTAIAIHPDVPSKPLGKLQLL